MSSGITAIVITKNEESNISRCLNSLLWCDEVIVIDDNSNDLTKEIAKKQGSRVYLHSLHNDFSQQRNFGLAKAAYEWVLFVDADEVVSLSLQYEITHIISDQFNEYEGFLVKRIDEMWGRKLQFGETGNMLLLRLAKASSGIWKGNVHETWNIKGKISRLNNPLFHYPHPTVSSFLYEINTYSTFRAQELFEKKQKVHFLDIILYPKAKFMKNYLLKRGFMDGMPGLIIALMMSFHSFLVRGKLWLLYQHE